MHHRQIESLHQLVDAYLSDCRHRRDGGDLTNSTLVTYEARRRRANLPDIAQARRMQAKDRRHHRGDNLMLARETSVAAACETICFTGARSGAVRLLQRTHVNVRTRTAVVHTKGADRTIVLSAADIVGHESEETTRTSYGDGSPELGSFAAADLFASIVGGAT